MTPGSEFQSLSAVEKIERLAAYLDDFRLASPDDPSGTWCISGVTPDGFAVQNHDRSLLAVVDSTRLLLVRRVESQVTQLAQVVGLVDVDRIINLVHAALAADVMESIVSPPVCSVCNGMGEVVECHRPDHPANKRRCNDFCGPYVPCVCSVSPEGP